MTYLPPFVLAQFMYLSQEKRWEKLIAYQQYLSLEGKPSLTQRIDWFIQRVQENQKMQEEESEKQAYIVEALTEAKRADRRLDLYTARNERNFIMTNDWLIQQLDELSEKSEYQDRACSYMK